MVCHVWCYVTFASTSPHGLGFLPRKALLTCMVDLIGAGLTKGLFEIGVIF